MPSPMGKLTPNLLVVGVPYAACACSLAAEAETPVDMETISLDAEAEVIKIASYCTCILQVYKVRANTDNLL